MTENVKHTPTPWVVRETVMGGTRYGGKWIEPEDAEYLVPLSGSGGARSYTAQIVGVQDHDHNDANAEFIVRAVNAHAPMLEALKLVLENGLADEPGYGYVEDAVYDAIAKAEAAS